MLHIYLKFFAPNIPDVTIGRASCKLATPHPLYREPDP